jgi:hypothetical protein
MLHADADTERNASSRLSRLEEFVHATPIAVVGE